MDLRIRDLKSYTINIGLFERKICKEQENCKALQFHSPICSHGPIWVKPKITNDLHHCKTDQIQRSLKINLYVMLSSIKPFSQIRISDVPSMGGKHASLRKNAPKSYPKKSRTPIINDVAKYPVPCPCEVVPLSRAFTIPVSPFTIWP